MQQLNWPVIGHDKIVNYLQTVIQNDSFSHAYLFYGPQGVGKKTTANLFLKSILCDSHTSFPCGVCRHCQQTNKQIHPDVIYLKKEEDKKNITVEQVRVMRSQAEKSAFLNSYKIILIPEADVLSTAAANAILKILEEPYGDTVFIFIAQHLNSLPVTIHSRCQLVKFMPVNTTLIEKYLINQNIDRLEARQLAHLSNGIPARILPLIGHPRLLEELKLHHAELLSQLSADINVRFALAEKIAGQNKSINTKHNVHILLFEIQNLLRDALLIKNSCFESVTHTWLEDRLSAFSAKYTSQRLKNIIQAIRKSIYDIDSNVNVRLSLENILLQF